MKESGFSPIITVVVAVVIILGVGAVYIFVRGDSSTSFIQPNPQKSIKSTKVDPSSQTEIPIPQIDQNGKVEQPGDVPEIEAKPAIQNSVIDEDGGKVYTNETFKFSVRHPGDYNFEERIRNFYNVESSEDPGELVYIYTLSNPQQLAPTGGLPGDKIIISVYNKGYEPAYQVDANSGEETVTVAGQKTTKRFGKEGHLITVGPLQHNNYTYVIQYEAPSALSDQTFFNAVLNSFTFTQ